MFFLELILYLFFKLPGIWGSSLSMHWLFSILVINVTLWLEESKSDGDKLTGLNFEFTSS